MANYDKCHEGNQWVKSRRKLGSYSERTFREDSPRTSCYASIKTDWEGASQGEWEEDVSGLSEELWVHRPDKGKSLPCVGDWEKAIPCELNPAGKVRINRSTHRACQGLEGTPHFTLRLCRSLKNLYASEYFKVICMFKKYKRKHRVEGCDCSNPAKVDVTETTAVATEMEELERWEMHVKWGKRLGLCAWVFVLREREESQTISWLNGQVIYWGTANWS